MRFIRNQIILLVILTAGIAASAAQAFDHTYQGYGRFLSRYVVDDRVAYSEIHTDRSLLDSVTQEFGSITVNEYQKFNRDEQVAYLINAYNLLTIQTIVDHFPVKSIKDIKGVWDDLTFPVAGKELTLDNIEHDLLRKQFREPRIHVSIVCASISCPALWHRPFRPDSLEWQLEHRSRDFATDSSRNQVDMGESVVRLSKILDWYGKDFIESYGKEGDFEYLGKKKGATVQFLFSSWPEEIRKQVAGKRFKVKYLKYNWNLNGK
jgi:hypothetical protein